MNYNNEESRGPWTQEMINYRFFFIFYFFCFVFVFFYFFDCFFSLIFPLFPRLSLLYLYVSAIRIFFIMLFCMACIDLISRFAIVMDFQSRTP